MMIEGRAAAEVVGLDERDAKPTARAFVCACEAMNAAAHNQEIVRGGLEAGQIAWRAPEDMSFDRALLEDAFAQERRHA